MRWLAKLWRLRTLWKWCPCHRCHSRRHPVTLAQWARSLGRGTQDPEVALMNRTNEILEDMVFREQSDGIRTAFEIRTKLPEVRWAKLHEGYTR